MDLAITQVPVWLSVLFIVLFISIPPLLIANAAKLALIKVDATKALHIKKKILGFYIVFFCTVASVSLTGFFIPDTFPPRILIMTALPLFLFYMFYIQRQPWFKQVLAHITLKQLVWIHIFRFVGVFFFLVEMYGALPSVFANIGGGGDVLTAVLVIPVVYLLKKGYKYAKQAVLVWNIIGLLDILSVLTTGIIIIRKAIENNDVSLAAFGAFPFSWIPAFAPATIIFLHILVFRKLRAS